MAECFPENLIWCLSTQVCQLGNACTLSSSKYKIPHVSVIVPQALNREQGIEWIKAERLPAFLQSDLYLEYQLAKLVSQSHAVNKHENQCFIRLKVVDPHGDSRRCCCPDLDYGNDSEDGDAAGEGGDGNRRKTSGAKEEEVPEYLRKLEKERQVRGCYDAARGGG